MSYTVVMYCDWEQQYKGVQDKDYEELDRGRAYLCYVSQIEWKQDMNPTSMG